MTTTLPLFACPHFQIEDANGVPITGAQLFFYTANTTNAITTYADSAGVTPSTLVGGAVVAGSDGSFAPIYINTPLYKVVIKDASNVIVPNGTIDNIPGTANVVFLATGGTADALTLTPLVALGSLTNNAVATGLVSITNATTTPTLAVSGLTAKVIRKYGAGSSTDIAVAAGDMPAGWPAVFLYSTAANSAAGAWILTNPKPSAVTLVTLGAASATQLTEPVNLGLAASVAASALTISLKGVDGNDPSATNPVYIPFRNVTGATGTPTYLTVTAATSLVISSGSTMGFTSAASSRLWIVGFNDGGTFRIGAVNCLSGKSVKALSNFFLTSSTAEGGAGGADSAQVIYTGAAVSSKAMAILGYFDWSAGLVTAGTWAIVPTNIQIFGPGVPLPGHVIGDARTDTGAVVTNAGVLIPNDDTIPQITEGVEYLTQAYVPNCEANLLRVSYQGNYANATGVVFVSALFRDSTANALAAVWAAQRNVGDGLAMLGNFSVLAGSVASTTFHVRFGTQVNGTDTFNGSAAARKMGGVMNSWIQVEEIMA